MLKFNAEEIAVQTADEHRTLFNLQMREKFGLHPSLDEPYLPVLLTKFADEYKAIMYRLLERTRLKIGKLRRRRKAAGTAREVREQADQEQKRLDTMARKIFKSELSQVRQQGFGVQYYIWRCEDDDRVRDEHEANRNQIFRWDRIPPNGHHPGQAINCRCWPEPIMGADGRSGLWEGIAQNVITQIPAAPKIWQNSDFVNHFYNGNGRPVTLAEIGHLGAIIAAVRAQVVPRFNSQIEAKAKEIRNGAIQDDFSNGYDFRDILYSHGSAVVKGEFIGEVKNEGKLLVVSGTVVYTFDDVFTDPSNYREYEYGTSDPDAVPPEVVEDTDFGGTFLM